MTVTAKDLVFTCTDRDTHDKTKADLSVLPVMPGHPPRSRVPPMFRNTDLSLPPHMEVACRVCGRRVRLGRRLQNCLRSAVRQGITEIDISRLPF